MKRPTHLETQFLQTGYLICMFRMDQTRLWKNSAYHKIGARTDINIDRNKHKRSDNDEMRHSVSYQQLTPLLS